MAHLIAARDFIAGFTALVGSNPDAHRSIALLAGQAVESLLEGYVLASLVAPEKPRDFGHDLEQAWSAAVARGVALSPVPPTWLQLLAQGHRSPFAVRYQAVKDRAYKGFAHVTAYAPANDLVEEIPKLEILVAPRIESFQEKNG